MKVFGWIVCAALALVSARGAEPGRIPFKVYGTPEGLPSASIHALAQDRDGFLWLGTENGLYRFDGTATTRWGAQDGLPSDWVTSLAASPEGGLWVGTAHGLMRLQHNRLVPAFLEGQPFVKPVLALAIDRRGVLWGSTYTGPFTQEGPLACVPVPGCPQRNTQALSVGPWSGSVWFAQGAELVERRQDGQIRSWKRAQGLGSETIGAVAEDGQGQVWVASNRTLFMLGNGRDHFLDRSAWLRGGLPMAPQPFLDPEGSVWMPSTQGILKLGKEGPTLLDPSQGLPIRWVKGGLFDREGNLWLLGASLAKRLGGGHVRVYQESEGLPSNLVWCVSRAPSGDFLAGTDDGLVRLSPKGFRRIPGTAGLVAFSVVEDGPTIWIAAMDSGLLRMARQGSQPQQIRLPSNDQASFVILKDAGGRVWTSPASQGVICLQPRQPELDLRPTDFNLKTITVLTMVEGPQGTLWASTRQGLFAFWEGRWRRFGVSAGLIAENVQGSYPLGDGTLWVWYGEPLGVSHLRFEHGGLRLLEHVSQKTGLPTDLIYGVRQDGQGRLWMTSDQGVLLLQDGVIRRFGLGQGLPGEDCVDSSLALDKDGTFWAGLTTGLVRIDPAAATRPLPVPTVQILQVSWAGQAHRMPVAAPTPVPYHQGTFEFRFAAPSFLDERALRYQVRLLGIEDEWRESDVRVARYLALPGGSYRFEARAAYPGGTFGPPATFDFQVRPPYWRTWWALAGATLLLGLLVFQAFRFRLRHLARSKARLEEVVADRTRELETSNKTLGLLNEQNLRLIEELATTLNEVKTLQGLIPICSYCKSIRNDDGYWGQIEQYIQAHSKATFSHGICPECEKKVREEWISQGMLPDPAKAKKSE